MTRVNVLVTNGVGLESFEGVFDASVGPRRKVLESADFVLVLPLRLIISRRVADGQRQRLREHPMPLTRDLLLHFALELVSVRLPPSFVDQASHFPFFILILFLS